MPAPFHKSIRIKKNIVFFLPALLFVLLLQWACQSNISEDDHPAYFTSIFKKVDTTKNESMDKAIAYMDSAFYAFPNPGDGDRYERFMRKWDYYSYIKRNYWMAVLYSDSLVLVTKGRLNEERFAELYTRALLLKGDCFVKLRRYTEAFIYFSMGRQTIMAKLKDKCSLAEYLGNIGNLIYAQRKYLLAAGYYAQQYKEQSKCGEDNYRRLKILQGSLDNAGICYFRVGMIDSASWYFDAALREIEKNEQKFPAEYFFNTVAKGVIYGNQAEVLDIKGNALQAENLYKKSITATEPGDIPYTQSTQVKLARMYIKNNDLQKAGELLNNINASLDTVSNELDLTHWFLLKTNYHSRLKETGLAKKFLQAYIDIKDSIAARDKEFSGIDVKLEFENIERQYSYEMLLKANRVKTFYLVIAVIISSMIIAIILLIWRYLRRSGRHVKKLKTLNLEIQEKHDKLQAAFLSLEQSHVENNRMMRIVAHDLKNPVSTINNVVSSVSAQKHPESLTEILDLIQTACAGSLVLIRDLSGSRKHLSVQKKEPVDMGKMLEYCVELLQSKADEKKQHLLLDAAHVVIKLNRQRIWRVISNILNNAIKFSHEHATIYIKLQRIKDSVLFSVEDNGIGIPADLTDKIFAMSPEASRQGTFGEESHGLGLSISQKIVEEHGGKIWFDSVGGQGTIFYVELPDKKEEVIT